MKWSLNDIVMNNILWLCLQTNRLDSHKELAVCFFELAFRLTNTNICQKTDPFICNNRAPMRTLRVNHTSKFKTNLFFICTASDHSYYQRSSGLRPIHKCIQSTQHPQLRLGCFWLCSVSWHPVCSEVLSSLLISAERSPIHPGIWLLACGTF